MDFRRYLWPATSGLLALALIVFARGPGPHPGAATTAPAPAASSPVTVSDGMTIVELGLAAQRRGGVLAQPLMPAGAAGTVTYGTVMDLQPVVAWASKLSTAAAQADAARAQALAANADLARTRALYRDDQNASLRSLQAAQAAAGQAQANAEAATAALQALRREGRLQFGAETAAEAARKAWPAPLDHRQAVVRVAMGSWAPAPKFVDVAYGGGPRHRARWLSPAPQADARLGADVQLYELDRALPAHASVAVYLPVPTPAGRGVFVPLGAVVWYADQAWVYVQRDDTHFARTALLEAQEEAQGFFVPGALKPGQRVVTRGAGLLLSLEQMPPPGHATGCKDPECD